MGFYSILKNSSLEVQLTTDYKDNGWSFQDGMAIHSPYNEGSFTNKIFRPIPGETYNINISVSDLSSGFLDIHLGGVLVRRITDNGDYKLTVEAQSNEYFTFTSGLNSVTIMSMSIDTGTTSGTTVVFDIMYNQFIGEVSMEGDFMDKFLEDFIVFKNGVLWLNDKSEDRNTFFGQKYPSVIKFYCNVQPDDDKDFFSLVFNGNMPWNVDLSIEPKEGKILGQRSRIKKGNFKLEKGKYAANVLRDMNDPRFNDELQALLKGAHMQGKILEVTITSNENTEIRLSSVEVHTAVK